MALGKLFLLGLLAAFGLAPLARAQITVETVTVGDPGVKPDPLNLFEGVSYLFNIGKYEVTAGQYSTFLNAIAASDPNGVYSAGQPITRSGSDGSYTYAPIAGYDNRPVYNVSLQDAERFVNWLHNGQPTGTQGSATTEDGAYDMTVDGEFRVRAADATWFIPTHAEWYKAAYYDPAAGHYWEFPTRSNDTPTAAVVDVSGNVTNPGSNVAVYSNTEPANVGQCGAASAGGYGTYDMAGNVAEWTSDIYSMDSTQPNFSFLGGWYSSNDPFLMSVHTWFSTYASHRIATLGFRVGNFFTGQADLSLSAGHLGNFGVGLTQPVYFDVHNAGPAATEGPISVTFALPTGLTFNSVSGSGWSGQENAGTVTAMHNGPLVAGFELPKLFVNLQVSAGAQPSATINASVSGPRPDLVPGNNADSAVIPVVVGNPPTASFVADAAVITVPGTVNFDASSSSDTDGGDVLSYAWDFGDGTAFGSGVAPSHLFETNGHLTVTLYVTDTTGLADTATQEIYVNRRPEALPQSVTAVLGGRAPVILRGRDEDGEPLTFSLAQGPLKGTLTGTPPLLVYTPNLTAVGKDYFTFRCNDGFSDSAVGTVNIELSNKAYELWAWGYNSYGQAGDATTEDRNLPGQVQGIFNVAGLSQDGYHSLAILADGTLMAWGANIAHQLGLGDTIDRLTPVAVPGIANVVKVCCGEASTYVLFEDGTVKAWGRNTDGMLGDGTFVEQPSPVAVVGLSNIIDIDCGGNAFAAAVDVEGHVYTWGRDEVQLGRPTNGDANVPTVVPNIDNVEAVACGDSHVLVLKRDGTVWGWGGNSRGEVGDGTKRDRTFPRPAVGLSGIVKIAAGSHHSFALAADGTAWGWGGNHEKTRQLGLAGPSEQISPVKMKLAKSIDIGALDYGGVAVLADGSMKAWGENGFGECGLGKFSAMQGSPATVKGISKAKSVSAAAHHALALVDSNDSPTAYASVSTTEPETSEVVQFQGFGLDPTPGEALNYHWDFGDGNSSDEQNPDHAYLAPGTYVVVLTVTDDTGQGDTSTIVLEVVEPPPSGAPDAEFVTTSDVAVEGKSITFDSSPSSDPEDNLVAQKWDFGDGTPEVTTQVAAKTFAVAGAYPVTLLVTDGEGLSSKAARLMAVLTEEEAAALKSRIKMAVKWDLLKPDKDALKLTATVNVGDTFVGEGTSVSFEMVGQIFTGVLDAKLGAAAADRTVKWKLKAGKKAQPFGTLSVKLGLSKQDLGASLGFAGVLPGSDPKAPLLLSLPVQLVVGGRTVALGIPFVFKFKNGGVGGSGKADYIPAP